MKYKHVTARILGLGLCVSLLSTVTLAASGIPYTGACLLYTSDAADE